MIRTDVGPITPEELEAAAERLTSHRNGRRNRYLRAAERIRQLEQEVARLKAGLVLGRYEPMRVTIQGRPDGLYEITATKFTPQAGKVAVKILRHVAGPNDAVT